MNKKIIALCLSSLILCMAGCGSDNSASPNTPPPPKVPPQEQTLPDKPIVPLKKEDIENQQGFPKFDVKYDIAADRQNFDKNNIDITVGDTHYMTQINDWYMNFKDYENKTVVIEGYFLTIDGHYFIGRNGPTCPYCTGGYVDFEFTTDETLKDLKPLESWIRVTGILRESDVHMSEKTTVPFYHIEAISIEKIPYSGKGTITD